MVYRGRPSTGCKKCRERKIKCDERPDGCVKCAEKDFACPGYDRTVDAFFFDETSHVQAKAKKSKAKAIAARDARSVKTASAPAQAKTLELNGPMPTLIDRGIAYFMRNYITGIDHPPVHSEAYHKHLSTDGFHPLVATSMTALGLAGIANLYMDPALRSEATRWYLRAIKMANGAISSPVEVKADTTLLTVNLLGMFEATFNDNSLSGWSNHVDGAASLVKLRGMDQFSTPAGQRMYLHTIGLLTMNCMGKGEPMPEFVRKMNDEVSQHLDISDPRNAFFFLHIKTIDLRARILNHAAISLVEIIDAARQLDEIAVNIFKDTGPDWDYETVLCDRQPRVFEKFYHVYPTAATAQTWNWVRYNRIYFHDIIRNSILAGFATIPPTLIGKSYHDQLERSTQALYKLQSDIIASMPQFLHDVPMVAPKKTAANTDIDTSSPKNTGASTKTPASQYTSPGIPPVLRVPPPASPAKASSPSAAHKVLHKNFRGDSIPVVQHLVGNGSVTDRLPIVRISGGYSTVWALYVAGSMPLASLASQAFVESCLVRIEQEFGIAQAHVLAGALRLKIQLDKRGATAFGICPQYLPPDDEPYVPFQGTDSKVGVADSELLMDAMFQAGLPSVDSMQHDC